MRTQWRMGPGGVIGLDYCAVYPLIDRMGLDHDAWLQMLDDITAMETAAIAQIHLHDPEN